MAKIYPPQLEEFMKLNRLGREYNDDDSKDSLTGRKSRFQFLKNTKIWPFLKPLRIVYAYMRLFIHKVREFGFFKSFNTKKEIYKFSKEYIQSIMPDEETVQAQKTTIFSHNVKFSILAPLYNTPEKFLRDMIESCIAQTYENWELCLADGSDSNHTLVEKIVKEYQAKDDRIVYQKLEKNLGISENTNVCIDMATGEYIALFDHDDILVPTALYENALVIEKEQPDFLYTDEATFNGDDIYDIVTYHFKPDFAIDNLRANNYICHFSVFKKSLIDKVGKFSTKYDGSQDHDMILRLTAAAEKVHHIPKLLYLWRSHNNSVSKDINSKDYAIDAGKRAVKDSLARVGINATVESSPAFPTIYKINYKIIGNPKISIIIPNKDSIKLLANCVDSILKLSTYQNYEIIIVENNSTSEEIFQYYKFIEELPQIKVCYYKPAEGEGFNYSKINNHAMAHATGEYTLFLNNDIEIIEPAWMEELLMYAQRKDVGAVGAKLYYSNDTIQHAGVIIGAGEDGVAIHSFAGKHKFEYGYMGRLFFAQNVSAVTAACMLVEKSKFEQVGGFDEKLAVAYNDVDLCLKLREAGYLNVLNPFADAYHYESITRGYDNEGESRARFKSEVSYMKSKWKDVLEAEDPFYNPNVSKSQGWKFGIIPSW